MKRYKLAVLTSHPIQYQGPLFRELAKRPEIDLTVYFCWEAARINKALDREFGKEIKWDVPLLDGYQYKFLKNWSPGPSSEFWGQINFSIIKELRQDSYDAILVFGWNSFTNRIAFITAFLRGIPVFLRSENPLNQELLKPDWKRKVKKIVLRWLFRRISAFLYIGEENKKFYQFYGVPEEKLFFCPYAVDNERFIGSNREYTNKKQIYEFRKELGIKKDEVVILFVGKLIEKKRPFDILKAYQLLTSNYKLPTTHLLFIGDGALRTELENYVREYNIKNVSFAGFKNQSEMPKYYALSDIFVLPSGEGETWGLAVNEAMCFSLPVVVSDLSGCWPDLVKKGQNGFIFKSGDIAELNQALEILLSDPNQRESFSKKSREIIEDYNYDNDILGILTALNNAKIC